MATRTFKLSVTDVAQQLCADDPKRKSLKVFDLSSNTVYITSAQNMPYTEGYPVTATIPYENKECKKRLWIIAATGTNDVRVQIDSE
jgi:hypothetical protein